MIIEEDCTTIGKQGLLKIKSVPDCLSAVARTGAIPELVAAAGPLENKRSHNPNIEVVTQKAKAFHAMTLLTRLRGGTLAICDC